jgi:hypothetical protein
MERTYGKCNGLKVRRVPSGTDQFKQEVKCGLLQEEVSVVAENIKGNGQLTFEQQHDYASDARSY